MARKDTGKTYLWITQKVLRPVIPRFQYSSQKSHERADSSAGEVVNIRNRGAGNTKTIRVEGQKRDAGDANVDGAVYDVVARTWLKRIDSIRDQREEKLPEDEEPHFVGRDSTVPLRAGPVDQ